jgi:hypothetical protein
VAPKGDVVEIGAYLGKSAILIGRHLHDGERFTVIDLFGADPGDRDNARENTKSYSDLTRERFEANYRAFHDELPVVVQAPSSEILEHVEPGTARFIHVDGSHLYEHVAIDVRSAQAMAMPDGVIAFDDFRRAHTPGTALAIWEAVATQGLNVIAMSPNKLYATFDDPAPHQARLIAHLPQMPGVRHEVQQLRGQPAIRLVRRNQPPQAGQGAPAATLAQRLRRRLAR